LTAVFDQLFLFIRTFLDIFFVSTFVPPSLLDHRLFFIGNCFIKPVSILY
jgi:hypothetical protein